MYALAAGTVDVCARQVTPGMKLQRLGYRAIPLDGGACRLDVAVHTLCATHSLLSLPPNRPSGCTVPVTPPHHVVCAVPCRWHVAAGASRCGQVAPDGPQDHLCRSLCVRCGASNLTLLVLGQAPGWWWAVLAWRAVVLGNFLAFLRHGRYSGVLERVFRLTMVRLLRVVPVHPCLGVTRVAVLGSQYRGGCTCGATVL